MHRGSQNIDLFMQQSESPLRSSFSETVRDQIIQRKSSAITLIDYTQRTSIANPIEEKIGYESPNLKTEPDRMTDPKFDTTQLMFTKQLQ